MEEYIKKETAYRAIMGERPEAREPSWFAELVLEIPAADVAPVIHSFWLTVGDLVYCHRCSSMALNTSRFCQYCGAKMDGEDHG